MAIVTSPLHSSEARGRTGGLIYNTWRGRSYVKTHAVHQSEFTDPQIAARATSATLTTIWQGLADPDRWAWNQFADEHPLSDWTGQPKRISGYNWFIRINWTPLSQIDTWRTTPPLALPTYTFAQLQVHLLGTNAYASWTPRTPPGDYSQFVIMRIEGPYKGPRTPNIKRARIQWTGQESDGQLEGLTAGSGLYYCHIWWTSVDGGGEPITFLPLQVP
jgi:hypothetical protein